MDKLRGLDFVVSGRVNTNGCKLSGKVYTIRSVIFVVEC